MILSSDGFLIFILSDASLSLCGVGQSNRISRLYFDPHILRIIELQSTRYNDILVSSGRVIKHTNYDIHIQPTIDEGL